MSDMSLRAIDCGFDPRRQDMVCVIPRGVRSVSYEVDGENATVSGSYATITRALRAAGYNVQRGPKTCAHCEQLVYSLSDHAGCGEGV